MTFNSTKRPRNVNAFAAAAILYGDWGTSKAYVIGLAFAFAGYSSFWIILPMAVLAFLVGINYITICKYYPNGGGVYASVRHRSQVISMVGAFFLFADYLVTASISALSAFHYLGVDHPVIWGAVSIGIIGMLNFLGPKHTGNMAFFLSLPTLAVVLILGALTIPHLGLAIHSLAPLQGGFWANWNAFVGVILALSGIEAIANTTGVMKLDPGTTRRNPCVSKTAKPAILWVAIEVCFFTSLFGLAMLALPGLENIQGEVYAPDQSGIRDEMLKYMGKSFATNAFGPDLGAIFALLVGIVFGVLLLSAVNTAIVGLISLLFLMSRDKEIPASYQRLNGFGVPVLPAITATVIPIAILLMVSDIAGLAELYAIGCVGAIATNLGSTSTDFSLPLKKSERSLMMTTFVIMLLIELTLIVDKPKARMFALSILLAGLILRSLVKEQRTKKGQKRSRGPMVARPAELNIEFLSDPEVTILANGEGIACAVIEIGKTLRFALDESKRKNLPLYLLFIRNQKVISEEDRGRIWEDDDDAVKIFEYAKSYGNIDLLHFCYSVSDSPADTIVDIVKKLNVTQLIMGQPRHSALFRFIRGNVVYEVSKLLPSDTHLYVVK